MVGRSNAANLHIWPSIGKWRWNSPRDLADEPIAGTPSSAIYEPMGPVFGVMRWNLPFWQVLRFFIPAAIAGNVVLVKRADLVQGSAQALEDLLRE